MDDKFYEVIERALINIARSTVDHYVEENASFRAKAGLKTKIIRSTDGKCCKWCSALAGIYDYPAPKEVYERHDNCSCKVTYVSEKGVQDVHTKRILKRAEFEERIKKLKENEIVLPAIFEDVKQEYLQNAKDRAGKVRIEENVKTNREKKAIENAAVLSKLFGEDIIILSESNIEGIKNPDYLWRNKLWEQKTVSSAKAVDSAIRTAIKQIKRNPGGIVLDISDVNETMNDIYDKIADRIRRKDYDDPLDVILIENDKIVSIIRYKKE